MQVGSRQNLISTTTTLILIVSKFYIQLKGSRHRNVNDLFKFFASWQSKFPSLSWKGCWHRQCFYHRSWEAYAQEASLLPVSWHCQAGHTFLLPHAQQFIFSKNMPFKSTEFLFLWPSLPWLHPWCLGLTCLWPKQSQKNTWYSACQSPCLAWWLLVWISMQKIEASLPCLLLWLRLDQREESNFFLFYDWSQPKGISFWYCFKLCDLFSPLEYHKEFL